MRRTGILLLCLFQFILLPGQTREDFLTGKFNPRKHRDFVKIANQDALPSAFGAYLQQSVYAAFKQMRAAALKDGVDLRILSATRTFYHQKSIWDAKWEGRAKSGGVNASQIADEKERMKQILEFSAMPGASRHHWGTDIDLNSLSDAYFARGEGLKVYNWLKENASVFGFCQPYDANRATGHREEKWHWSYAPLSVVYLQEYAQRIDYTHLSGFAGSRYAKEIQIIRDYVLSVGCDKPVNVIGVH